MSSLELREKIKLRELLERDITVTQQKTQNLPSPNLSQEAIAENLISTF